MNNITYSGLKSTANGKQNTITSSTNLACNSIRTTGRTYATSGYNINGGNITLRHRSSSTSGVIQSWNSKPLVFNHNNKYAAINGGQESDYNYSLYVFGYSTISNSSGLYFTDSTILSYAVTSTNANDVSAYFGSSILSQDGGFYFASDKRIKTNIQDIDDDSALKLIMKIEPKTYEYIDKIEKGNVTVYGFIAQQIKDVIPEAVSIDNETIPNIYKIGILNNSNLITMDMDISDTITIGSNITLLTSNIGKEEYKITNVNSNQFTVDKEIKDYDNIINSNIFVYGTKVNDFHILDKNYIYTLNVCATQELYKLIKINENDINQLRNQYENMSNNFTLIKNKIYK